MLDKQQRQQTQAMLEDLKGQLVALKAVIADAESRVAEMTNTLALVSSVPDEIIAAIFKEVCLFDGYTYGEKSMPRRQLPSIVLASHVNRRFRRIAIGTPALWTNIDLHLSSITDFHLMDVYLERSKPSLLDIHIISVTPSPFDNFHRGIGRLFPHCGRWKSLSVEAGSHICIIGIIPALEYLYVPQLVSARIYLLPPWASGFRDSSVSIFQGGAPSLRRFKLINISFVECRPPISTLDTLDLLVSIQYPRRLYYDQFRDILTAATSLTTLRLSSAVFKSDTEGELEPINLPSLRTLELFIGACSKESVDHLILLFRALRIPNLQALKLDTVYGHAMAIMSFLHAEAHRYPLLRSLALKDIDCSDSFTSDLIRVLPNITSLSLIRSAENVVLKLLMDRAVMTPQWPQLESLELAVVDFDLLRKFLSSRDGPIVSLTLMKVEESHAVPQDLDGYLKAHVGHVRYIDMHRYAGIATV